MLEMCCQVCGETYNGDDSADIHHTTSAGEYCGGMGVVTRNMGPTKQEKRQKRAEAERARYDTPYTLFDLNYVNQITELAHADGVTQDLLVTEDIAVKIAQLQATNETNRLIACLISQTKEQSELIGYLVR